MNAHFPRKLSAIELIEQPLINSLVTEKAFLENVFRHYEKDSELTIEEVTVESGCQVEDSSTASISRVTVMGNKKTGEWFRKSIMVKRSITAGWQPFRCDSAFQKEMVAYKNIIPVLECALERSSPPLESLPFPKCLQATSSLIILEDLQPFGFEMVDRTRGLDYQHSAIALQTLGRFHGVSLALKHTDPELISEISSNIKELVFFQGASPTFSASLENSLRMALMGLEGCEEFADSLTLYEASHKLQMLKGTVFQRMIQMVTPKEPLAVICHGDFWLNNLLFKRNAKGEALQVAFVDLQVLRYASPATDLLHFLYTSTSPGVTRDYYDELIEEYRGSLNTTLKTLAPEANEVTTQEILAEMEERALYGLIIGFLILPVLTAEADSEAAEIKKFNAGSFDSVSCLQEAANKLSDTYFQRVKQLVLEFVDKGYI